jgi:hypothetical protein
MELQAQLVVTAPLDLRPPPLKSPALLDFRARLERLVLKEYPVLLVRQALSEQPVLRVQRDHRELLARPEVQVKAVLAQLAQQVHKEPKVQSAQQAPLALKEIKV